MMGLDGWTMEEEARRWGGFDTDAGAGQDLDDVRTRTSTYPLRLPAWLKAAAEKLSKADGTSINQFVVVAIDEKVAAMTTEELFAERRARADLAAFDRIMNRGNGAPPQSGDELAADLAYRGPTG